MNLLFNYFNFKQVFLFPYNPTKSNALLNVNLFQKPNPCDTNSIKSLILTQSLTKQLRKQQQQKSNRNLINVLMPRNMFKKI